MKKALRIILPVILILVILFSTIWYLFVYDRPFTRDVLLSCARYSESSGKHNIASWLYNVAYAQSGNSDDVAIELAKQYKAGNNFTKAEFTLRNAILNGGGIDVYVELCKTFVEQDKLLDAVKMLDSITNPEIKAEIDSMRPAVPTASPSKGTFNQFISVTLNSEESNIYASANGEYPSILSNAYEQPINLPAGESKIQALTINEIGLVSELAIFGEYIVVDAVHQMEFQDSVIEKSVREILKINENKTMTNKELWEIKSFIVPDGANDLSDIQYMKLLESLTIDNINANDFSFLKQLSSLNELTISNTRISQEMLAQIAELPALTKLTLSNCSITGVSPLSTATGLVHLDLNNNTIRNIETLGNLANLSYLNLQHNAVTDISALSGLSKLGELDISYNGITSLAPVSTLASLSKLDASVNSISELGNLGNLTGLTQLSLKSNQLTNVDVLSDCIALSDLDISSNTLTDIAQLETLSNLMYFDFSNNQITSIPKFKKDSKLVTITGSHNQISTLENLSGLAFLNYVNMDYNENISSVKPLTNCRLLIEVNLYGTKVKDASALTDMSIVVNIKPV